MLQQSRPPLMTQSGASFSSVRPLPNLGMSASKVDFAPQANMSTITTKKTHQKRDGQQRQT